MERVTEHVAAKAAVDDLTIHGNDALNAFEVGPAARESAEHDAGIPGIVGDEREGFERPVVGMAIIDDFDRRADRVRGPRDLLKRNRPAMRAKIAPCLKFSVSFAQAASSKGSGSSS